LVRKKVGVGQICIKKPKAQSLHDCRVRNEYIGSFVEINSWNTWKSSARSHFTPGHLWRGTNNLLQTQKWNESLSVVASISAPAWGRI